MLHQQIINECNRSPFKWKMVKTGRGYLFAVYREDADKITNIAETDDLVKALQFEKIIHPDAKKNPILDFGLKLKKNIELRCSGKEEKYIELTQLKQWRKDAGQPIFDKFGNKRDNSK